MKGQRSEVPVIRNAPETPMEFDSDLKPKKWKFKLLSEKNSSTVLRKTNYDHELQVSTKYTRANHAPDIVIPVELFQRRAEAEGMVVTKKIPYRESQLATSNYIPRTQITVSEMPVNA